MEQTNINKGSYSEKYSPSILKKTFAVNNPDKFKPQSDGFLRYKQHIYSEAFLNLPAPPVHYPELNAKSYNDKKKLDFLAEKCNFESHISCSTTLLRLKCNDGHVISKSLYCGREWCKECGKKKSIVHLRRIARWKPKTIELTENNNKVHYMVVTIPEFIRDKFKTKFDLSNLREYLKRKIKREYNDLTGCTGKAKGLMRWHFAGDCKRCKGKGCLSCQETGADRKYNPHLNIILNCGFIDKAKKDIFKRDLEKWFTEYTKINCTGKGNIYHSYTTDPQKVNFWIRYITRATWRFYEKDICKMIKGFRNNTNFGKFEKPIIDIESSVEFKCCPVCLRNDGVINKLQKFAFQSKFDFDFSDQQEILKGVFYTKIKPVQRI